MISFNEIVTPATDELREGVLEFDIPKVERRKRVRKTTREEIEMSRMTYDGVLLQSQLAYGEARSIEEIAQTIFTREGEEVGPVALNRAKRAAMNLVTMGQAKAIPNKKSMTHIESTASNGTQLGALMNLAVRRAEQGRADRRAEDRKEGEQPVVIADLTGTFHSKM